MLEVLVVFSCPVVVGGDLNIHVENPADDGARRLHELLTSFDMIQNVNMPTHRCNGTLDLVITFADYKLDEVTVDPPGIIADRSLVVCHLPVEVGSSPVVSWQVRAWRQVDRDELRRTLQNSALCQPVAEDADVDMLFSTYDQVLRDIADVCAAAQRATPSRPLRAVV